jgi:thymidylate synthase ThyX
MKIVKQNAQLLRQDDVTPYEHIERIGRVCYKSEDKITPGSAAKFVTQMKNNRHYAMLEHYWIHMVLIEPAKDHHADELKNYISNYNRGYRKELGKYIQFDYVNPLCYSDDIDFMYVSGSFRSFIELIENMRSTRDCTYKLHEMLAEKFPELFEYKYKSTNTSFNIKIFDNDEEFKTHVRENVRKDFVDDILWKHITHSILFTTDRGVSHELVRHRPCSFSMESTRYCNYSKGKFNNEITVIEPCFYEVDSDKYNIWKNGCEHDQQVYFDLINLGCKPHEARDNLPTSVKTDITLTATESEWQHIINLRYHGTTGAPHPQMLELMKIAYPLLIEHSEKRLK